MSYIKPDMKDSLKDHVLERVLDTEKFQSFYMKRPGQGRMMSTLLVFTPEGIVIMGDLCPSGHGAISVYGKGIKWFIGTLSEGYLCEKFLQRVWQRDAAVEGLKEEVKAEAQEAEENPDDQDAKKLPWKKILEEWTACGDEGSEQDLYGLMWKHDLDTSDGAPGYDYPRSDAGWLCAIQQRFAELYQPADVFKAGDAVLVDHPRYKGPGIVDHAAPAVVYVKLGNGNVWAYEVETVHKA